MNVKLAAVRPPNAWQVFPDTRTKAMKALSRWTPGDVEQFAETTLAKRFTRSRPQPRERRVSLRRRRLRYIPVLPATRVPQRSEPDERPPAPRNVMAADVPLMPAPTTAMLGWVRGCGVAPARPARTNCPIAEAAAEPTTPAARSYRRVRPSSVER
jgi:hypothetical protein